jgi:2-hydroxychromene-2-carboxylate isomerase
LHEALPVDRTHHDVPVSPYSWFGFTNILRYRPLLNKYGVSVEIIPFFLGGARESVGNTFVPTPKWKEAFAAQDSELTGELLGLKVVRPKIWPVLSLFVSCPFRKTQSIS